jgi:hypothetical protein
MAWTKAKSGIVVGAIVLLAAGITAVTPTLAKVSVVNRSGVTISNVWVSGPHFAWSLGSLAPGVEEHLDVRPGGESRAWLSYEAGGQKIDRGGMDYFKVSWMHPVSVTVGVDLKFTTPSGITSH